MIRPNRFLAVSLVACAAALCSSCATKPPGKTAPPATEQTQKPSGKLGTVQCATPGTVEVLTDKGVLRFDKDGKLELAPGTYSVMAYSLRAKHSDGAEWRIVGQAKSGGVPLQVKAGETAELAFGPPLKATLVARKMSASDYAFSVKLTGQAGESYSPRDITRAGQSPAAPKVEIRSAADASKVVASGSFQYG